MRLWFAAGPRLLFQLVQHHQFTWKYQVSSFDVNGFDCKMGCWFVCGQYLEKGMKRVGSHVLYIITRCLYGGVMWAFLAFGFKGHFRPLRHCTSVKTEVPSASSERGYPKWCQHCILIVGSKGMLWQIRGHNIFCVRMTSIGHGSLGGLCAGVAWSL